MNTVFFDTGLVKWGNAAGLKLARYGVHRRGDGNQKHEYSGETLEDVRHDVRTLRQWFALKVI